MRLSPEQFAEITRNPATGEQLKGEKRASTRIPLGRRSTALVDGMRLSVVIREVSITGASLVASLEVPLNERLILHIPSLLGSALRVICSVVRCERGRGERVFVVGLKFEAVLIDKTLAVAPAAANEPLDVTRIREAMLGK